MRGEESRMWKLRNEKMGVSLASSPPLSVCVCVYVCLCVGAASRLLAPGWLTTGDTNQAHQPQPQHKNSGLLVTLRQIVPPAAVVTTLCSLLFSCWRWFLLCRKEGPLPTILRRLSRSE